MSDPLVDKISRVLNESRDSELMSLYRPELPFDQQTDCIEAFFTPERAQTYHIEDDGSDESSQGLIRAYLSSHGADLPSIIVEMLNSWLTDGF